MILLFRTPRPAWKLLLALALVVFLGAHSAPMAHAQTSPAPWAAKQPLNKPNTKAPAFRTLAASPPLTPSLPPPRPGWSYPQRQTLTYEVDWRVFPAGTTTAHLENNSDAERITVTGDSTGAINLLLRVSDHFQSTFNRQSGCSSLFAKQISEGAHQITSDQQLTGGQSRSVIDEKTLITHTHRTEQVVAPACVSDALSAIVYAASQPMQVGRQFHIPVVYGENVLDVIAHVETHEAVRTPTTTYQALRVQATWANNAVKNSGNIWVWYTDDDRHIPVQVRARLFWGTITFRLTSVEAK